MLFLQVLQRSRYAASENEPSILFLFLWAESKAYQFQWAVAFQQVKVSRDSPDISWPRYHIYYKLVFLPGVLMKQPDLCNISWPLSAFTEANRQLVDRQKISVEHFTPFVDLKLLFQQKIVQSALIVTNNKRTGLTVGLCYFCNFHLELNFLCSPRF